MENSFAHKSCRLTGFEFRISYYDETLEFYQKLGFVIHKEIEDATKKSVWFRNQHDQMDENSSFFVFTWNKSDNVEESKFVTKASFDYLHLNIVMTLPN